MLDVDMKVYTLTVEGTLQWDTSKDNVKLSAKYVLVERYGRFELGTESNPMNLKATIYILEDFLVQFADFCMIV